MDSGLPIDSALSLEALPRLAAVGAPSPEGFERLVAAEAPVVIKGLVDAWPALVAGRSPPAMTAYLKGMDSGLPGPVMEAPASTGGRYVYGPDLREFSFSKRSAGVGQALDRVGGVGGDAGHGALQRVSLRTRRGTPRRAARRPRWPDAAPWSAPVPHKPPWP